MTDSPARLEIDDQGGYFFCNTLIITFHIDDCSCFRGLGLNPLPGRFGIFTAVVFMMHYLGEVLGIIFMGIFQQPGVANSVTALVLAIAGLISSGFVRYVLVSCIQWSHHGLISCFEISSKFHSFMRIYQQRPIAISTSKHQ